MNFAIELGLDTLSYSLSLLLVCLGLVIIFGLMNVINMAHGEFFLLGAYAVVAVQQMQLPYWMALILAPVMLAIIGMALEELVIRHVYHRFIDTILATWGISIVLKQLIVIMFGPTSQSIVNPLPEPVHILGVVYPSFRLFIMGVALVISFATFWVFYRSNIGLAIRGVIANRPMAASLGLNTRRMDRWTFAFGAALAGFAGAVMAPIMSVDPQMGSGFLIPAFLSIMVGGIGHLLGVVLGAGIIGTTSTVISSIDTQVASQVAVFLLAIIVIRLWPEGLIGRKR
ncbi:branched-chain amino acid ABC transporter permease [Eoetvoesiella caeni]|uniref:Amino acid/amide ABC transporter membrane protein 1 (HAAT family) n=1 Tax=Eoetvoesiella caeni TaxID=645616 RepID=A0A366HHL6_9BURK|nr:branched-chain amino acid ABC transporter permease [Eoetvoesiella caeni]MCI2808228.1 branched-chain amino acid ABC transporter permease [Eoetvoesiella caeni]NYT53769.1 branched-chain amino acid ABC transporter permease [Eoetvoesiella caeni]RBP42153.1 amino acid/amide ABC transporter membrane protein 1 (HAAT family) [Eoetvoesiella caeni]